MKNVILSAVGRNMKTKEGAKRFSINTNGFNGYSSNKSIFLSIQVEKNVVVGFPSKLFHWKTE